MTGAEIPADISVLIGPQLIGVLFNWLLLGVLTVQAYLYSVSFSSDRLYIKIMVYGLYVTECVQTAFTTSDAFTWFVYGWGNPESIEQLNLNWFDVPVLSGLISMAVQCFFAWRVWLLSKSLPLAGVIIIFSLLQGAAAMAAGIKLKIIGTLSHVHELYHLSLIWLVGSAVTDVLIAISMTVLLLRSRSVVLNETKHIIRRLVHLTVETGSLTASMAVVTLILFKQGNLYIATAMIIAKLYSNTFLAVFNNRAFVRRGNGTINNSTDVLSNMTGHERGRSDTGSRSWTSSGGITFSPKHTEVETSHVPLEVYGNDGPIDLHDKMSSNAMPLRVDITTSTSTVVDSLAV